jgi:hypothetical protein
MRMMMRMMLRRMMMKMKMKMNHQILGTQSSDKLIYYS